MIEDAKMSAGLAAYDLLGRLEEDEAPDAKATAFAFIDEALRRAHADGHDPAEFGTAFIAQLRGFHRRYPDDRIGWDALQHAIARIENGSSGLLRLWESALEWMLDHRAVLAAIAI